MTRVVEMRRWRGATVLAHAVVVVMSCYTRCVRMVKCFVRRSVKRSHLITCSRTRVCSALLMLSQLKRRRGATGGRRTSTK